jgi:hypothetical protein
VDYYIQITRKKVNDKNVYTIPFWLGRVPGMPIDLVLATDCEWTFVAGKNCTHDSGCQRGVYDHHMTTSEKVNWTLLYQNVSLAISFEEQIQISIFIIDSRLILIYWLRCQ